MRTFLIVLVILLECACATRRMPGAFRVLPAAPEYLLRSPDASDTPFTEILSRFTNTELRTGAVDLQPQMEMRIEQAYYRNGKTGFLGTDVARYQVRARGGVRLVQVESNVKQRPAADPRVQDLIRGSQRRARYYRYFYAVVFREKGDTRGSVLLGASSLKELNQLGERLLADPDSVCGAKSPHCTVFPQNSTVSLQIAITVNGVPRTVAWGSSVASVAPHPAHLELLRNYEGRLAPVELTPTDRNALRLPLLPGDQLTFD